MSDPEFPIPASLNFEKLKAKLRKRPRGAPLLGHR